MQGGVVADELVDVDGAEHGGEDGLADEGLGAPQGWLAACSGELFRGKKPGDPG